MQPAEPGLLKLVYGLHHWLSESMKVFIDCLHVLGPARQPL